MNHFKISLPASMASEITAYLLVKAAIKSVTNLKTVKAVTTLQVLADTSINIESLKFWVDFKVSNLSIYEVKTNVTQSQAIKS